MGNAEEVKAAVLRAALEECDSKAGEKTFLMGCSFSAKLMPVSLHAIQVVSWFPAVNVSTLDAESSD